MATRLSRRDHQHRSNRRNGIALPEVGTWYRRLNGNLFEVVAIDDDDGTVELQHFDGTIEELDFDSWFATDIERVQAPEDWSGSVDIGFEDLPEPEASSAPNWQQTLDLIDRLE